MRLFSVIILLATYAWLFWCLSKGRIKIRQPRGGGDTHEVVNFDKNENPFGFWVSWIIAFIGSTVFCIYILFQTYE